MPTDSAPLPDHRPISSRGRQRFSGPSAASSSMVGEKSWSSSSWNTIPSQVATSAILSSLTSSEKMPDSALDPAADESGRESTMQ